MLINVTTGTSDTTVSTKMATQASGNLTTVFDLTPTYGASEIFTLFTLTVLCVIGTVGNGLVIYVFAWKKRRNRKPFETLLSILAVIDLFASMIVPVLFFYGTITEYKQWHFGYVGCKVISSLFPASVTISQGILILISYERYKCIKYPFDDPIRKYFIFCWLIFTFLAALILVSPYVYALDLVTNSNFGINTCIPSSVKHDVILLYSIGNFLRDFAATSLMVALGVMTNRVLKKGSSTLGSGRFQKKRKENSEKARQMLIVVVCVFTMCVLPLDLYQVIVYTLYKFHLQFNETSYKIVITMNTYFTVFQIANSATNVLIYSRMHKDFTRQLFSNARSTLRKMTHVLTRMESEKEEHFIPKHSTVIDMPSTDVNIELISGI